MGQMCAVLKVEISNIISIKLNIML